MHLRRAVVQQVSVGQTGQRIEVGLTLNFELENPALLRLRRLVMP